MRPEPTNTLDFFPCFRTIRQLFLRLKKHAND